MKIATNPQAICDCGYFGCPHVFKTHTVLYEQNQIGEYWAGFEAEIYTRMLKTGWMAETAAQRETIAELRAVLAWGAKWASNVAEAEYERGLKAPRGPNLSQRWKLGDQPEHLV